MQIILEKFGQKGDEKDQIVAGGAARQKELFLFAKDRRVMKDKEIKNKRQWRSIFGEAIM